MEWVEHDTIESREKRQTIFKGIQPYDRKFHPSVVATLYTHRT